VVLEKEDEMECLVSGCNFFLKAIRHEAFTFEGGQPNYIASNGGPPPRLVCKPSTLTLVPTPFRTVLFPGVERQPLSVQWSQEPHS